MRFDRLIGFTFENIAHSCGFDVDLINYHCAEHHDRLPVNAGSSEVGRLAKVRSTSWQIFPCLLAQCQNSSHSPAEDACPPADATLGKAARRVTGG